MHYILECLKRIAKEKPKRLKDGSYDEFPADIGEKALNFFQEHQLKIGPEVQNWFISYFRGEARYFYDKAKQEYSRVEGMSANARNGNWRIDEYLFGALDLMKKARQNLEALFIVTPEELITEEDRRYTRELSKSHRNALIISQFPTHANAQRFMKLEEELRSALREEDYKLAAKIKDHDMTKFFSSVSEGEHQNSQAARNRLGKNKGGLD